MKRKVFLKLPLIGVFIPETKSKNADAFWRRTLSFSSRISDEMRHSPDSGSERSDRTLRTRREAKPTFAADDPHHEQTLIASSR